MPKNKGEQNKAKQNLASIFEMENMLSSLETSNGDAFSTRFCGAFLFAFSRLFCNSVNASGVPATAARARTTQLQCLRLGNRHFE